MNSQLRLIVKIMFVVKRFKDYSINNSLNVAVLVFSIGYYSASRHLLLVPRYRLSSLGRRSFAVAGPMTWISLSADLLRDPTCSDESFRRSLKTFLFAKY